MGVIGREIVLHRRPDSRRDLDIFAVAQREVPEPGPGQLVVRSTALSVDPSMIPRLTVDTYAPRFELHSALESRAVGQVVMSRSGKWAVGEWVLHSGGWRELAVIDGAAAMRIRPTDAVPPEAWLDVLGAPGLTAYVGLQAAVLRPGDVIWVSAAAGAVGAAAAQLAKARGAGPVIGSAGGPDKCRHLVDVLGLDAAIDYQAGDLEGQLRAVAPDGIDVYVDNVGGDHLRAALATMRIGGRIAACGMVSSYGAAESPPPNLSEIIVKRLRIQGFLVTDHLDARPAFEAEVSALMEAGTLRSHTTSFPGLGSAAEAMASLLGGSAKLGKAVIAVDAGD